MKTKKLVEKFQKLVSQPPEETPRKKLCKTIRALKKKQRDLEGKLRLTEGKHSRQRLEQKIEVLRAQRRKGVALYKQLKNG